ncbi:hypothetical protein C2845_PM11G20380 [Panicum miliaceum]|uniref:NB-ARC domain-containing protein n=1 Tax=Panicum miliaceum TaxID=4540 RepID=A0A3L6RRG5_PANMI|nr:hypothetical protein C2845_PM11G20380 [Panicum miliaceum]
MQPKGGVNRFSLQVFDYPLRRFFTKKEVTSFPVQKSRSTPNRRVVNVTVVSVKIRVQTPDHPVCVVSVPRTSKTLDGGGGTLSLVKTAVEEEKEAQGEGTERPGVHHRRVRDDAVLLRVTNRERAENEVELTWVRQLRYLAFDVEDCVEFVVHLNKKSRWGWLRRLWQTLYCRAPPLPLDVAVDVIKQLKARVEDATGRRRRDLTNLQELIAREDDDLHVISVWGGTRGDLGTASILRKAYCDPKLCRKFEGRAWVKLMHPFNHDAFVKSLLTQFYATSLQADAVVDFWTRMKAEVTEDDLMKAKLRMTEQRYLVVLEDVFTVAEWDLIRIYLPDSKNGSRMVVSTPQIGIALLCAGEPYQVSELRQLSQQQQFLCAFSKKTRSDMGEFNWHLRRRGVISVWGAGDDKSILVDKLYKGIMNQSKEFFGVEFERHSWVDVPDPFNLKLFAQRLFLEFHSNDIRASEIKAVGMMGEQGLIQRCCEFLSEEDCLVVINGLQSMGDWDLIKSKFLSKPTKGCILVITIEETVAMHCVKDQQYQALNVKDLEADTTIFTLINKGSWHYRLGGINKGRLFYDRRKDALEWTNKFKNVDLEEMLGIETYVANPNNSRVYCMASKNGTTVARNKAFLRNEYYRNGSHPISLSERRSWVHVPHPFNLMDFSWRLLLDFYSDDPKAKEAAAVGLMEGKDPIQECREFLREEEFFVVIDGLCSTKHWDLIKATFLSGPIKCTIVVITNNTFVEWHCLSPCTQFLYKEWGKVLYVPDVIKEYNCRSLSGKRKKATEWTEKFELVGREKEGYHLTKLVVENQGVVSVWGIAGVGKSSLVMSVYYTRLLQLERMYRMDAAGSSGSGYPPSDDLTTFGWVDVPDPFNLTEFSWRLLLDFHSDDPQAKETAAVSMMEGQDPILECCKFLREEECLVVIDGLRSTQDWDLIKATFLSEPTEGTIVVITNEAKVAVHCVENNENKVLNVRRLEADDAVLKKIIWEGKELTHEEMKLPQCIVAKCGGLPKVIAAIGEVCNSDKKVLKSLSDNFMGTLEMEPRFHSLRTLFSWMQSYFDACPDSIKPCIFYLSIFSADKDIRRRRLLWRWIAEGYCRDTYNGTSEENGEKFVSELVNLSIIQEQSPSKVLCQINGFFHEYIISRPMEDNLVFALEGCCSLNSQRTGQHLTIRSNWDRDETVFKSIDFSRLRSLTVFRKWMSFFISSNINIKLLRVLDLEDAFGVTNDDIEQIGKLLTRLKFLSLRGYRYYMSAEFNGWSEAAADSRYQIHLHSKVATSYHQASEATVTNIPATTAPTKGDTDTMDGEDNASSSVTNLPAAAPPPPPTEGDTDTTDGKGMASAAAGSSVSLSRPRFWISSLLPKFCRGGLDNGGIEIGKLSALHTFGFVNVNGPRGRSIFEELKKLTQLRKLGVSGINKGNIKDFCCAISGHAHLKSLSVELDKDDNLDGLDDIPQPPKTLNTLKLYGQVKKLLVCWVEQLDNLKKLKLDLTIVKPEELGQLRFPRREEFQLQQLGYSWTYCLPLHLLRIRPIQDGELVIGDLFSSPVVEIQCSSTLRITFSMNISPTKIEVLKLHCSRGASFQISQLTKLDTSLKEVWLKGHIFALQQHVQQQIDEMDLWRRQERPVLKVVRARSS